MRTTLGLGVRAVAIYAGFSAVFSLVACGPGTIDGDPLPMTSTPPPTEAGGEPSDAGPGPSDAGAAADAATGTDAGQGEDVQLPMAPPVDSTGYPVDDPGASDTQALSADLVEHLSITKISSYQSLEVPLERDGVAVPRRKWDKIWGATAAEVPIVAGRDALLRIFVRPDAGFANTEVTARVKLQHMGAKGLETRIFSAVKSVGGASSDGDLGSTINVTIPAAALVPGIRFGVVLNAPVKSAPPKTSPARYPQDGSLADLGASAGGDVLKVVLVPMRYLGDGSGRMPDTSAAQVEIYRDQFFRKYPVARVEVRVRAAIDYTGVITHDAGIGDMLNVIGALHDKDHAGGDEYYVGLLQPAAKFWDFCGSGCVAGLSFVGNPSSVWWGYSGTDWAGGTGAHEVGHAHGLPHAPCGTTDPDFWPSDADHASAKLGAWGWDPIDEKLFDPGGDANPSAKGTFRDVMSYCGPTWIGDFNYAKLWHRIQADNGVKTADLIGAPTLAPATTMESVFVDETGRATWAAEPVEWSPWMENGRPMLVPVVDADGKESTRLGWFFPYDHLPGGRLLVPTEPSRRLRAIRHDSRLLVAGF